MSSKIPLAPAALSVLDCFSTIHITPEQIGLPEQVTFEIPLEDGSVMVLMLPKSYAQRLIAKAAAAHLSTAEFLAQLLQSVLQEPIGRSTPSTPGISLDRFRSSAQSANLRTNTVSPLLN
jgi:hypothetical protein